MKKIDAVFQFIGVVLLGYKGLDWVYQSRQLPGSEGITLNLIGFLAIGAAALYGGVKVLSWVRDDTLRQRARFAGRLPDEPGSSRKI